uniref:ATP synthase subunit a n=1 Tax=Dactyloptena peterseni TaxID=143342 RepID=Q94SD7_DACPE|nr:ATP synthase F0 subunit 6 [Dactyloptena peterseni]BAB70396.1 ATPase subunit 6 [Dactyloptena peterseni]
MILSLFDQFETPWYMGVPLIAIAIASPWLFLPVPTPRWLSNRLLSLQAWFVTNATQQIMLPLSPAGQKWALLFTSLMMYIISLNLLGLLPYTFTPTTQLSMSLGLAVPLWLATVLIGMRNQPSDSLAHLLPEGTPTLLIPVLIIIETISLFIRPLALGVRLTANLTAGHLLIQLVSMASLAMASVLPAASLLTSALLLMLTLLEVAVAMIQAYVFVLLLSLYLQENV